VVYVADLRVSAEIAAIAVGFTDCFADARPV